ncbi:TPA: hypothetical protein N0F65_009946 [Lagenidium giganteum]|uniref:Uncharacterized protein n=1 Tax=Lagenidium giganteum TaxID=4803 RepID=A0AAV2YW41_9STRA|nr:TPA: hypothetical protein N0F65_009946 [Lagenidium giganteum]
MRSTTKNALGEDEYGRAILWSSAGQQVMMEWEKNYMEQCVDALCIQPHERVLEIGFGLAYSASRIQSYRPAVHAIIECDPMVLQKAHAFAATCPSVQIVEGLWQDVLHDLGIFDCVFFDDFPLPEIATQRSKDDNTQQRSRWHDFLDQALLHVAPGGRITGYLARDVGLERAGCVVTIKRVTVDVPSNCTYFPYGEALVPIIRVQDVHSASDSAVADQPLAWTLPAHSSTHRTNAVVRAMEAGAAATAKASLTSRLLTVRQRLDAEEEGPGADDDTVKEGVDGGEVDEPTVRSQQYCDQQSRAEYLKALRTRAAAKRAASRA